MNNRAIFRRDEIARDFLGRIHDGMTINEAFAAVQDPDEHALLKETYEQGYFLSFRWVPTGDGFICNSKVFAETQSMVDYVTEVRRLYPMLRPREDIVVTMRNTTQYDKNLPSGEVYDVRVYFPKGGVKCSQN